MLASNHHHLPLHSVTLPQHLEQLPGVVSEAVRIARSLLRSDSYKVTTKEDGSYVTTVDLAVSEFLQERLPLIFPAPVISEESIPPLSERLAAKSYWIVDPIDNTAGMVERGIEHSCINIALFIDEAPAAAAIHYFADDCTVFGLASGDVYLCKNGELTAFTQRSTTERIRLVAYRSLVEEMSEPLQIILRPLVDSGGIIVQKPLLPLRLKALIQDEADLYVEPRRLKEWDVAAGMLLVQFLGGTLRRLDSRAEMTFNSPDLICSPFTLGFVKQES